MQRSSGSFSISRGMHALHVDRQFSVARVLSKVIAGGRGRTRPGIRDAMIRIFAAAYTDGARLIKVTVTVTGSRCLELRNYRAGRLAGLKSLGCFTEIIAFRTGLFVPRDRATAILEALDGTA